MSKWSATSLGPSRWLRARLLLVAALLLAGFAALLARAVQIQVLQQEFWSAVAAKQTRADLRLQSRRGDILDRHGHQLAASIEMESLAANPRLIENGPEVAARLAPLVDMPAAKIASLLQRQRSFVWIRHHLPPRQADAVRNLKIPGLFFVEETRRYYPNGDLAGHLLGFVGRDRVGLEGLELALNDTLQGRTYKGPGAVDARGKVIYTEGIPEAATPQGHSVRLSIDKRIQHIAERELASAIRAYEAKGGTAVVIEPNSGAVLALAVHPPFDPNNFHAYQPATWRNRAVTDAFEPGSTFKVFLAAAAIEEKIARPDDLFYCGRGRYRVQNHTIKDIRPYGWLSLAEIIKYSSNIGAIRIAEKLGARRYYQYIKAFGFGAPTGIGLPGETPGLLRPPEQWSELDLAAASFGQSLSVSAIQLAMAVGAIANDGLLMRPLLVREVLDSQGNVLFRNQPQPVRRVVSRATAATVKELLTQVMAPDGTGARGALAHYTAAGKTGTAQRSSKSSPGYDQDRYTSLFIGFVPAKDPKIALVVVIHEPKRGYYGGIVAAPAFRHIAEQSLHCLKAPPDKIKSIPPARAAGDGLLPMETLKPVAYEPGLSPDVLPDLTGMSLRAALNRLRSFSCRIEVRGSGKVVAQSPAPGTPKGQLRTCSLILAD